MTAVITRPRLYGIRVGHLQLFSGRFPQIHVTSGAGEMWEK